MRVFQVRAIVFCKLTRQEHISTNGRITEGAKSTEAFQYATFQTRLKRGIDMCRSALVVRLKLECFPALLVPKGAVGGLCSPVSHFLDPQGYFMTMP